MEESWLGSALPYLFFFGLVLIIAVMTLFTVQRDCLHNMTFCNEYGRYWATDTPNNTPKQDRTQANVSELWRNENRRKSQEFIG